jgi:hypothetical protein
VRSIRYFTSKRGKARALTKLEAEDRIGAFSEVSRPKTPQASNLPGGRWAGPFVTICAGYDDICD